MCQQSAVLPADIDFQCTNEELCMSLEKIMSGSQLPGNVIQDVNPYQYVPSNLPDGVWYLIHSNENKRTNFGHWRAKEEASSIFSNSFITGWRATLEFYQGQAPHESKTNWVMQEFWITQKLSEENKSKEAGSLCRVFLGDEENSYCKELQKIVNSDSASKSTPSAVPHAENCSGLGSTSNPQVRKDNETGTLIVTEIALPSHNVEIIPEMDCLSRGDYLELLDLDTPASVSFSSISSCLTMSSDECFDSLALLEELEPARPDLVHNNAGCKFSISAPLKPDELVMYASPGPSSSCNVPLSLNGHSAVPEGEKKASTTGGTSRKLKKYFCFIPF